MLVLSVFSVPAQSTFSGERLREAVISHIKSNTAEDAEIYVSNEIEDCTFRQSSVTAKIAGNGIFRGKCYAAVEFRHEGKTLKRLEVPCDVKIFKRVPTAAGNIARGEIIREKDIVFQRKDITYFKHKIEDSNGIIGREAKVNIPANSIFTDAVLKKQDVVKRGSKVEIHVLSGAVQISVLGSALQDAATGEQVRVRRDGSRTILTGTAGEDGSVYILAR